MIRSLTALAFAAAFAAPAIAFDNTTCKAFLTGTWDMTVKTDLSGRPGEIATRAVYDADGEFRATVQIVPQGLAAETQTLAGTWDAAPGPSSDSCNASVATGGREQIDTVLIVLDTNTIRTVDGATARRVPAAGIRAASIAR